LLIIKGRESDFSPPKAAILLKEIHLQSTLQKLIMGCKLSDAHSAKLSLASGKKEPTGGKKLGLGWAAAVNGFQNLRLYASTFAALHTGG